MFDELATAFGNDVRWVGGSAARHDESSWGEGDSDPYALDHWVKALQIAMQENDSMINTVNLAHLLDQAGPTYDNKEHPQSIFRNGGETINHRALGASYHNAILWAGHADGERHVHDIQLMYNTIRQAYIDIGEPYTITVLGDSAEAWIDRGTGDQGQPAGRVQLAGVLPESQRDFLFFASNHGGTDTYWQADSIVIDAFTSIEQTFALSQAEIEGMRRTTEGIPRSSCVLRAWITPAFACSWTASTSAILTKARTEPACRRSRSTGASWDASGSEIDIRIDNRTDFDVTLIDGLFRTGGIDNVFIPEPGSFTLAVVGCVILVARSNRRTRR